MTRRIGASDPACGFRCGKHALDDYFTRHALPNDQAGIGRAYVLEPSPEDMANFYSRYDFVSLPGAATWPRRMFLAIEVARAAFA